MRRLRSLRLLPPIDALRQEQRSPLHRPGPSIQTRPTTHRASPFWVLPDDGASVPDLAATDSSRSPAAHHCEQRSRSGSALRRTAARSPCDRARSTILQPRRPDAALPGARAPALRRRPTRRQRPPPRAAAAAVPRALAAAPRCASPWPANHPPTPCAWGAAAARPAWSLAPRRLPPPDPGPTLPPATAAMRRGERTASRNRRKSSVCTHSGPPKPYRMQTWPKSRPGTDPFRVPAPKSHLSGGVRGRPTTSHGARPTEGISFGGYRGRGR